MCIDNNPLLDFIVQQYYSKGKDNAGCGISEFSKEKEMLSNDDSSISSNTIHQLSNDAGAIN